MATLLFDRENVGGLVCETYYDEAEDCYIFNKKMDVEPTIRSNIDKQNHGHTPKEALYREMAEIPAVIIHRWLNEGFNIFRCSDRELRAKLNDPDWKYLKTIPGAA
jgi:hypothetical protein